MNLKQIGLGLAMYRRDADDKLPPIDLQPAAKAPRKHFNDGPVYGWADAIQIYLKSTSIYYCPAERHEPVSVPEAKGYTDYWINSNLAGSSRHDVTSIMMGDGNGLGTARYSRRDFPSDWQLWPNEQCGEATQAPWFERHLGGANYAFADGHVKWLRPDEVGGAPAHF